MGAPRCLGPGAWLRAWTRPRVLRWRAARSQARGRFCGARDAGAGDGHPERGYRRWKAGTRRARGTRGGWAAPGAAAVDGGGPAPPGLCFPGTVSPAPAPSQATFRLQVIGGWAAGAGEQRRRPGAPPPRPHPARPRREAPGYFWPVPSAFGGPAQAAPSWTHPGGRPGTPSSAQATLCSAPACRFFEDLGSDLGLLSSDQGGLDVRSPPGWAWGSDGSVRARAAPSPTLVGAAPGWARRLVLACPVTLGRVTAVGSHCASVPLTS